MKGILLTAITLSAYAATGQYAPQAGLAGSTAVAASSGAITGWANHCSVQRGYLDIADPSAGTVSAGDDTNGTGPADGGIVSLGDSGIAVLSFPGTIYDGPGPDFAVFENGFRNPSDSSLAFLELAFVEVSSDGLNYSRFPAHSLTPANTQIPGSGVYMDATLVHNLAGKYVAMFGTPFDLADLGDVAGLDINAITHVRLVDAVGAIVGQATYDTAGNAINDPYPTNFPTGGFDLDAVAAIHMNPAAVHTAAGHNDPLLYPNPVTDKLYINYAGSSLTMTLFAATGQVLIVRSLTKGNNEISLKDYPAGLYYVSLHSSNGRSWVRTISKY